MDKLYYNVRASLEICTKSDIYDADGYFFANKKFFCKDYLTKKFAFTWRIPQDYPNAMKNQKYFKRKIYDVNATNDLLRYGLLYKISNHVNEIYPSILLTITNAAVDDLFFSTEKTKNQIETNIVYYEIKNDKVIGPYFTTKFTDVNELTIKIEQQKIFILTKRQLFEPFLLQKSA